MIKSIHKEHYGEDFYWFIGKVVNDLDPEFLGRVQVRVYGIHSQSQDDLPNAHLPWAQCLIPSTEGGISGIGKHAKILPGALVFGFFMDGKSCQIPFILGSIHHTETQIGGSNNATEANPDVFDPRGRDQIPGVTPPAGGGQTSSAPGNSNRIDTALPGGTSAEKIFNFFTRNGLTPAQASGFIGNFYAESSLNPAARNPNDKGKVSEGLAQWRGSRRDDLIAYSQQNGLDYKTLDAQLNFVMHELRTTETKASGEIKKATTPKEAAIAVSRYYERPEFEIVNGQYTSPSLNVRTDTAIDAYNRFARGS